MPSRGNQVNTHELVAQVKAYWANRGYAVEAYSVTKTGGKAPCRYIISDLVNGAPRAMFDKRLNPEKVFIEAYADLLSEATGFPLEEIMGKAAGPNNIVRIKLIGEYFKVFGVAKTIERFEISEGSIRTWDRKGFFNERLV